MTNSKDDYFSEENNKARTQLFIDHLTGKKSKTEKNTMPEESKPSLTKYVGEKIVNFSFPIPSESNITTPIGTYEIIFEEYGNGAGSVYFHRRPHIEQADAVYSSEDEGVSIRYTGEQFKTVKKEYQEAIRANELKKEKNLERILVVA